MLPVTATAAEPESEENTQTCSCDTLCTEGDINSDCPVCGAEEADLSQCAGTGETETEPSEDEEPAESTGDASEQPETVGEVDAAVTDVQAKIDALPTADDLADMSQEEQQSAYEQVQTAYDAYQALSDDQKEQISGVEVFDGLFDVFNNMTVPAEETHSHPVCGLSCTDEERHGEITWEKWTNTDSMPSEAGNYYLSADVTLSETWEVPEGKTMLCLNGYSIAYSNDDVQGSVIRIPSAAELTVTDCTETPGKITGGTGVYYANRSNPSGYTTWFTGGYCGGGLVVEGMFNFYKGSIEENIIPDSNSRDGGGGVFVDNNGTFNMYGGAVQKNSAKSLGSGLLVYNGTFNMYGGVISENGRGNTGSTSSFTDSCAIWFLMFSKVNMTGGEIRNNKSTDSTCKLAEGSTMNISGNASIVRNEVRYNAGGIYCVGASLTMEGGKISDNSAIGIKSQGSWSNYGFTKIRIKGGEISANSSYGIQITQDSAAYIEDGEIVNNGNYDVYLPYEVFYPDTALYLSGGPSVGKIYVGTGKVIHIDSDLTYDSPIGITMQTRGYFTSGWTNYMGNAEHTKYFQCSNGNDVMELSENELRIIPKDAEHYHDEVSFDTDLTTLQPSDGVLSITSSGNYYLSNNMELNTLANILDTTLYIGDGENEVTVNLCLNGYQLSVEDENSPVIIVRENAVLNIYDCGIYNSAERERTYISPIDNQAKTISGGLITGGTGRIAQSGEATYSYGGGVLVYGTLNLHGGTIAGNSAVKGNSGGFGGGVYVVAGGMFNMSGGEVKDNKASTSGGGVTVAGGEDAAPVSKPYKSEVSVGDPDTPIGEWTGGTIEDTAAMQDLGQNSGGTGSNTTDSEISMSSDGVGNMGRSAGGNTGDNVENGIVPLNTTEAEFTLSGGSITANNSAIGGGINSRGKINVASGSAIRVTGNTGAQEEVNNVYFPNPHTNLTIQSAPTEGTSIGVRMAAPGQFAETALISSTLTGFFSSDDTDYGVVSITRGLTLNPVPQINTESLDAAYVGTSYTASLSATVSGGGNITWRLVNDTNLPAGLTLNTDGTITGTPTKAVNNHNFMVQATVNGVSNTKQLSITVNPGKLAAPEKLGWNSENPGTATWETVSNATSYTVQLYKDGVAEGNAVTTSAASYSFTITKSGSYTFTVTATDGNDYNSSTESEQREALVYYDVDFNVNGGNGEFSSQVIVSGGKVSAPAADPSRQGYTFIGWYSDNSLDEQFKWNFNNNTVTKKLTLYAKWEQVPSISVEGKTDSYLTKDVVVITPTVGASGVGKVEVSTNNGTVWEEISANADAKYIYEVTVNGTYLFRVTNGIGVSSETVSLTYDKIDPAKPEAVIAATFADGASYKSNTWTNRDVTLSVSNGTANLGDTRLEYQIDSGVWKNYTDEITLSTETDADGVIYNFKATSANGESDEASITVKIDKTDPIAKIGIKNKSWKEFLNTVTFGLFFKETTDVSIMVEDVNTGSGIKSVEYLLSETAFISEEAVTGTWTKLTADSGNSYSFSIEPKQKAFVYVRATDNAGNSTIINSAGVVVYKDAAQDTESISFTKLSKTDVSFSVTLNGNTVKSLALETTGEDGQTVRQTVDSTNYSVGADGTITLRADYLQSLAAGTYTVRVEYNPLGENYVEVEGNVAPASTTVDLKVQKADRNAPGGYNVSAETISGKEDGTITGLSSEMEYRKDGDTDYAEVNGTELTSLASGVYYVRYAQTGNYNASDDARIEVKAGRKLKVTVPDNQTGYTLTADSDELDWHGNTKLTFTLSDGYSKTDDFAVTAAPGTMVQLQDNKDGTYTLSSIEDDVAISVAGVADITAPAAEIKICNSSWKEFLNTVTFGHFFKKTTDVTITAEDVDTGSGVDTVEYLLSEKKFEYKEDVDGEWAGLTENNGIYTFSIEPDHKAFVYVRVTDKAGNITIINSAGIVVYTDAAQDTGSITFTKLSKADAFFKVKLNGNTVKSLALETTDEDGQTSSQPIDSENYTVGGSTITLKADYLQSLEVGKYTVRVEYNPLGESYVEDTDNEAPLSTTVELNIQRVAGTVTIDKDTGKIYDGTAVSPVYSTNNKDGEAVVEYKAKGADDAKYTTAAPRDFGDYTVRVTVKADEEGNYTEASAVQDFEIRKKELTVNVSVSDKQYDGLDTAQFDGTPELSGVVEEDEVTLINGEPSFSSVAVGENISINLTDFTIHGEDAENYYLTQPEGITANIYNNYNAEQDTDYTVNSNEWLNTDFVITAMNGYSLSLTNTAGGKWTDILSASDETADGILEFYVRNNSTGAISTAASENYKIDKTAPTGEIKIGENGWKEFLNNITFGLFFKETQTVSIDSDDTLSGIATVEYASSETPLKLEEVKALTSWQKGESTDVTPEDGKRFIYYARITDNAGNVICLSTDGAEYDLTAPVINGISDGGTYCISAEFTVSENNLKEVQVDGSPAAAENGAYTLTPGEHTVKVVDKADNSTQIKVTVNEKHTPEEDDGDCTTAVKCSVCGEVTTQAQEQHDYTYTSNGDGTHTIGCTRCGYSSSENCSGGKADCTSQAVCDKCGQPYGDKDPANHTNLVKTEAKPATHLAEGNTEYWYCDGCNRYFSDEAGTQEISLAETVIPKLTEHTADGTGWHLDEDSHWHTCECGEIIDKAGHTFEWVTDKEATETETGSKHEECTVCGYEKEAVEIPATGTQDEPAEPSEPIEPGEPTEPDKPANAAEPAEPDQPSETPHATGDDKTESAETLQTGDDSNYILWIVLLAMSGVSITGTAIYRRKRKDN